MRARLLLFSVAALLLTFYHHHVDAQVTDECLTNSIAPSTAQRVRNSITQGANFLNLDTKAKVVTALRSLLTTAKATAFNDFGAIIVGTDTKDFYGVAALDQDYWIFDVRNQVVFGDSVRRQYATKVDKLDLDTVPDNTINNFDPTARPWYQPGEGWSTYQFAGGFQGAGTNGSTYHIAFPGGVVGVDRNFKEQCSQCLTGSLANPVAQLMRRAAQTYLDGAPWQDVIRAMLTPFNALRNDFLPSVLIGTPQGRAYVVTSCKADPSQCVGVSTPYVAQVGVAGLTEVGKVTVFPLSENGELGASTGRVFDFDPRLRPWYNLGDGWTGVYQFALGSTVSARTFTRSFNGGVIGVDRYDTEPCNGCLSCSAAPTPSPTCSSGGNVINVNFANLLSGSR